MSYAGKTAYTFLFHKEKKNRKNTLYGFVPCHAVITMYF